MANEGKCFEEDFYASFEKPSVSCSVDRVYDNTGGYAGVAGYCDFNVFLFPHLYHFEMKHVFGTSLPFSNITDKQFSGLITKAAIVGIFAGIVTQFEHNGEHNQYFVPIQHIDMLRKSGKRKSITEEQCLLMGTPLVGHRVRTRYKYDVIDWLKAIAKRGTGYEVGGGRT